MDTLLNTLKELFSAIPRRHSADNVKEIYGIIASYEDALIAIEGINSFYEKNIATFFEDIEIIKQTIKKSNDGKASKKNKDVLFDEASGMLKENMEGLINFYADGKRVV